MNAARRKTIADIANRANALGSEAVDFASEVENVLAEEQDAFDNMPESLQDSERGQIAQAALDALQEAIDALNEAESAVIQAVSALETAAE